VDKEANVIKASSQITVYFSLKAFGGQRSERYQSDFVNNRSLSEKAFGGQRSGRYQSEFANDCLFFTKSFWWTMARQRITVCL
jgi:hypothetical protein